METLFVLISGVLLMISAILGEQLAKKLRIAIWVLFVILLISYAYINIKMENARKIEKGKDDTKISELTKTNQQVLEINKELLEVVKEPNFAKNPETLSKVDKIERNLSLIENKPKAILKFLFFLKEKDIFIDNVTVPIEKGVVTVDFTAKNISTVQASNGQVWIQICDGCKFAEEPQGSTIQPSSDLIRRKHFDSLYAGSYFDETKLKIIPPSGNNYFYIAFKYSCENCPPIDYEHPQKLRVNY